MTAAVRSPGHETCNHRVYDLGCDEFDQLLERADGQCELCGIPADETPRGMLVCDHDHRYGQRAVRGMVCDKCNSLMAAVDAGKAPETEAVRRYCRKAWFVRVGALHCGHSPFTYLQEDSELWREFSGLTSGRRYAVVRDFVAWYCGTTDVCPRSPYTVGDPLPVQPRPVRVQLPPSQPAPVEDTGAADSKELIALLGKATREAKRLLSALNAAEARANPCANVCQFPPSRGDVVTVDF